MSLMVIFAALIYYYSIGKKAAVEAELGDNFLTLSTCSYYVDDRNFVVVTKREM